MHFGPTVYQQKESDLCHLPGHLDYFHNIPAYNDIRIHTLKRLLKWGLEKSEIKKNIFWIKIMPYYY